MKSNGTKRMSVLATVVVTIVSAFAVMLGTGGSADAAEVRPGRGAGQVDVLLSSSETRSAATSLWGTSVVCATTMGSAGAIAGFAGWFAGYAGGTLTWSMCMMMTGVCAARAYVAKQRAGITYAWNGAWCWRY